MTSAMESRSGHGDPLLTRSFVIITILHAAALVFALRAVIENLNVDGIVYMRIASYYAAGSDLALSAYWGPLLSWLMVPLLVAGMSAPVAARAVMGVSALLFAGSAFALSRASLPSRFSVVAVHLTASLVSIPYAAGEITPDLLLAGLFTAGLAVLARGTTERKGLMAGLFFSLAFLAKAPAIPLVIGAGGGLALLKWRAGELATPERRALAAAVSLPLLTAGVWSAVLSMHESKLTIPSSGYINHAVMGPGPADRYHPTFREIHFPEEGRVTQWEDPDPATYNGWTPFESAEAFRHQIRLARENLRELATVLLKLDPFFVTPLAVMIALVAAWRGPIERRRERWPWLLPAVVVVPLLYVPVHINVAESRFLYPMVPPALVLGAGAAWWLGTRHATSTRRLMVGIAVTSFCVAALGPTAKALRGDLGTGHAMFGGGGVGPLAHDLARQLAATGERGPIVGGGEEMMNVGLLLGFLTDAPWYGESETMATAEILRSGARLVVVYRDSPLHHSLVELGARLVARDDRGPGRDIVVLSLSRDERDG